MSDVLRVGVIGVGSMGMNHARLYSGREDVELVGVCDSDLHRATKVAKTFKTQAFDNVKRFLDGSSLDGVSVAVPTRMHRAVAEEVLSRGINLLLEKPIAESEESARSILHCARENGVSLIIGHVERFNPAIEDLKIRIARGELTGLYRIEVDRVGPFPSRIFDVGVTLDLAVHDLEIISSLLKCMPTSVFCEGQQLLHEAHEDAMFGVLRYPTGLLAVLNINWTAPVKRRQLRVYGKEGMFVVDYIEQRLFFYENSSQKSNETSWELQSISEGSVTKFQIPRREPLAREIDFFVDTIRHPRDTYDSVRDSMDALKLANVLRESMLLKRPVLLAES